MPTPSSYRTSLALVAWLLASTLTLAEDKPSAPQEVKHQVTGLFCPERVEDLHKAAKQLVDIELVKVDYATAEAIFRYDPAKVFPNAKPEQIVEQFNNQMRNASRHTFGITPLCAIPRDKLQFVEIPVVGLDCKACSLGAYEIVYKLDGVEQATASFKTGLVTAWIDPSKTNRKTLEETLVQRNVTLKEVVVK
jgi:cation transport ATPase